MKKQQFELIICSVLLNQSELVIKTAKEFGVTNATFIKGRGTGDYETQALMGISLQPEKEVILMVVPKEKRRKVMQEVAQVAGLNTPADGICFSMPIEGWTGTLPKIVVPKPQKEDESKQLSVFDAKSKTEEEKSAEKTSKENENIDSKESKQIKKDETENNKTIDNKDLKKEKIEEKIKEKDVSSDEKA